MLLIIMTCILNLVAKQEIINNPHCNVHLVEKKTLVSENGGFTIITNYDVIGGKVRQSTSC